MSQLVGFTVTIFMVGYLRSNFDPCLYVKSRNDQSQIYLVLYVDDILIAGKDRAVIADLKERLQGTFFYEGTWKCPRHSRYAYRAKKITEKHSNSPNKTMCRGCYESSTCRISNPFSGCWWERRIRTLPHQKWRENIWKGYPMQRQ